MTLTRAPLLNVDRESCKLHIAGATGNRLGVSCLLILNIIDGSCRPDAEAAGAVLRSPKAMLSTLDSLKREDYAIGVIALALGVGVAHATGRVSCPCHDQGSRKGNTKAFASLSVQAVPMTSG